MDESRYVEWEALWDDDGVYWVPARAEDYDPGRYVSIIYDDKDGIHNRVERLRSGLAYTQEPRSQVRRVISNIRLLTDGGDVVEVASNFAALEHRLGRWTQWAGRTEHRLRGGGGRTYRIARKKVVLVGCDTDLPMLQFLL